MSTFPTINTPHSIRISIPLQEADLAIASIDNYGFPGQLNSFVLLEYGYEKDRLPNESQLLHGFFGLSDEKRKPILFVVTVTDDNETVVNLRKNLFNTLSEFRGWFRNKKVWLPLMGTGVGGLSYEESYIATVETINQFQLDFYTDTTFLISIPFGNDGNMILNAINNNQKGNNVEQFLSSFKNSFYLVGSIWGREDQSNRFFKDNIWEKGHDDDTYSDLINEVKPNDILMIKSSFAADGISYLRIKAIGIVTENPLDGGTLKINWGVNRFSKDIGGLGYYRNTITKIDHNDIILILSELDSNLWSFLIEEEEEEKVNSIAGFVSDSDRGIDYLEITKDVTAFARVIAAKSFEPPLAIALFGKWGAGKSFFMQKLKDQIIKFSDKNSNDIYCKGIVHIHFNAWSYMDANLWASIVTRIFESLNEYISENSKSEQKREIEEQLTNQLSITREEIDILERKKESVKQQINSLESKKTIINEHLKTKISLIEKNTLWNAVINIDNEFKAKEKLIAALNENHSYINTTAELKKIIPEKYWENPNAAYNQIKSKQVFLKEFFNREKIGWNLFLLGFLLVAIFVIPSFLQIKIDWVRQINLTIIQSGISFLVLIGAIWKRGETVYNNLQPIISSFWAVKEDYDSNIKRAISEHEQEEKAIRLEIEKSKAEIILLTDQIQKSESLKTEIEFKINNALATEALYTFIDTRSKSDDYKKHLGLISTIRRDFETLSNLFTDHNKELSEIKKLEAQNFRNKFDKPLERIVLYIDDLDRCPEENVVQVIEAVNLLMAFPLFVVVVGVDSRWVKNALMKKHALQFTGRLNKTGNTEGLELIEPSQYLEKIFQIPFHLKSAENTDVKKMIEKLAQIKPSLPQQNQSKKTIPNDKPLTDNHTDQVTIPPNRTNDEIQQNSANQPDKYEAIILTDQEIIIMQHMSDIIDNNPRAIKRFVNIYRIIKAHEEFTLQDETSKEELPIILFLVALPLGPYRILLPHFESYIEESDNQTKKLYSFMQKEIELLSEIDEWRNKLDIILSDKPAFIQLQKSLISDIRRNHNFIKRFTFKNI